MTPPRQDTPAPRTRKALLLERAAALEVVVRVDRELAALEDLGDADEYSSTSLPPHTSRRAFREACARGDVAGATKSGAIWSCSRAAWREALKHRASANRWQNAGRNLAAAKSDEGSNTPSNPSGFEQSRGPTLIGNAFHGVSRNAAGTVSDAEVARLAMDAAGLRATTRRAG